ncbi:hypothetical protein HNY73_001601 [Argiope bruennichi]|uniref:Uncharacterized protein n=1 Tax=Argiope bruennichi TaxID=94029 RepID=A0A8T0G2B7_ARGBR|nr:hypothetical protein HNY73_001601 [Argiope bruennichi]
MTLPRHDQDPLYLHLNVVKCLIRCMDLTILVHMLLLVWFPCVLFGPVFKAAVMPGLMPAYIANARKLQDTTPLHFKFRSSPSPIPPLSHRHHRTTTSCKILSALSDSRRPFHQMGRSMAYGIHKCRRDSSNLSGWISRFSKPEIIMADQSHQFESQLIKTFLHN